MVVNADSQDVKLILDGVELTNPSGSPMVVTAADEVTLSLANGTENTISDADAYADASDASPSSTIDSASDLSIAGNGSLSVTGNNNDAINSADGLDSNAAGTISGAASWSSDPPWGKRLGRHALGADRHRR